MYKMKSWLCFRRVGQFLVLLLLGAPNSSPAQYAGTNGIFAEFYTSMGNYTCRLDFVLAPKTVANFIGQATGERAWLDTTTGTVRTNPLHNNTIFHRVVSNFVIQAGSPNGSPSGGPGYLIRDEISTSLKHDSFGVLAMGNTGPDSNGSQYYVTVGPQPVLDGRYSVFGKLFGGSNVIYNINRVVIDASERPLTNVTINTISIRRIGAAALAFDINTNGLPVVTNLNLRIAQTVANIVSLSFSNRLYADNRIYASANLTSWSEGKVGIETANPVFTNVLLSAVAPKQFFRMVQIQYSSSTFAPMNMYGRMVTLQFTAGLSGTMNLNFNGAGTGSYSLTPSQTGSIISYSWSQDAYRGYFSPIQFSNEYPITLRLNYQTANAGIFEGVYYYLGFFQVGIAGTFTATP